MQINGVWVGWGLNDNSKSDFTVRKIKDFMRRKFSGYAGGLADTNLFDLEMLKAVTTMQRNYVNAGKLRIGTFIDGVLDLETQYVMGYKLRPVVPGTNVPKLLPVIFSVEGHLSNMWAGPTVDIAMALQAEGKAYFQPVGYDNGALPFNNRSGISALQALVGSTRFENGVAFPPECPWGIEGFSQGAMIASDFIEQHVLNPQGSLHWRLPTFKRGLMLGNPRREQGQCVPWSIKRPAENTKGIMDHTFNASKTSIADKWAENATDGDMFAVITLGDAGEYATAIAKIVTENSWAGGDMALLSKLLTWVSEPVGQTVSVSIAIIKAIMFLAKNPNPHYSTTAQKGDIDWMRGVAA